MSILIRKPGILTTVQDLGRRGRRRSGINPNGAMDTAAARIAAVLAGLSDDDAVIEMHFPAPEIVFEKPTRLALAGADFGAALDGEPVAIWRTTHAPAGARLKFEGRVSGARCYLAIGAGLGVAPWLGSRSTNLRAGAGGFEGRALRRDDRIEFADAAPTNEGGEGLAASYSLRPHYSPFPTVRAIAGAEFTLLDAESRHAFLHQTFVVSNQSDRMGFRLDGASLRLTTPHEVVSSGVDFGTVQLMPDGRPTILMADHQTAGGYARIAHVIPTDLPLVAQLGAHDKVGFHLVGLELAEAQAAAWELDFRLLRTALRYRLKG